MRSMIGLLAGVMALASPALAQDDAQRQLGAHEHGHGRLNIAIEGERIHMELEAPGADVMGFEHKAESEPERRAEAAALARLREPLALFALPAAAGCRVGEARVRLAREQEEAHAAGHDETAGHGAEHKDEHAAGHKDAHGADTHDAHDKDEHAARHGAETHDGQAEEAGHSEVHAQYVLACRSVAAIDSIRFLYFAPSPHNTLLFDHIIRFTQTGSINNI